MEKGTILKPIKHMRRCMHVRAHYFARCTQNDAYMDEINYFIIAVTAAWQDILAALAKALIL